MTTEIEPDFAAMTMEEMDAWIIAEDAKTPFTSFDLGTDEGRQGLLRKYYMIGDTCLFEAVSHIWASLNEPKAAYCTGIAIAAGSGGTGKGGLVAALHLFLGEALAIINAIPSPKGYSNLDEWHQASMRTFEQDEKDLCVLLARYSIALNGGLEVQCLFPSRGSVIFGPWGAISARAMTAPVGPDFDDPSSGRCDPPARSTHQLSVIAPAFDLSRR